AFFALAPSVPLAPLARLAPAPVAPDAPLAPLAPVGPRAERASLAQRARAPERVPAGADPSLLAEIRAIRAIDNHAHVPRPVADAPAYDALPFSLLDAPPPGVIGSQVSLRPDNPAFVRAWKALFNYPHADASPAHLKDAVALKQKAIATRGAGYPAWVLDQPGI